MNISKKHKISIITLFIFSLSAFVLSADSTYVVKKGDTLYSISRKYQITVAELRTANNLSENDVLKEGAKLIVPSADISNAAYLSTKNTPAQTAPSSSVQSSSGGKTYYVVKAGDTFYGIARKFGLKLPELLSMNNLDASSTLKVGQKLVVPASDSEKTSHTQNQAQQTKNNASENTYTKGISWPVTNPSVKNISGKVSGVLLYGSDNESVKVVREGTVMYTGVYRGFGEVVFVQSKTGLIYSYSGLNKVTAKKGDYVVAGTEIGKIGKGNDACLKFMVFQNGKPVDPAKAPRG